MSYLIKINIENEIKNLYNEILLREPDKTGLYYFMSQIESNKMTLDDVKSILYDSGEATSIRNYSHYTDKYWNDLLTVKQYKNKLSTDNENMHWLDDIPQRFKKYFPFKMSSPVIMNKRNERNTDIHY